MNRVFVSLFLNLLISNLYSQGNFFEFKGQISLQSNVNFENDYKYFLGGRYFTRARIFQRDRQCFFYNYSK